MSVYDEIKAERETQDQKWGGPEHDDQHAMPDWLDYITDKVMAIPETLRSQRMRGVHPLRDPFTGACSEASMVSYRRRLVQIAALAVAAIESFDRLNTSLRNSTGITEVITAKGTPRGAQGDCG